MFKSILLGECVLTMSLGKNEFLENGAQTWAKFDEGF